MNGGWLRLMGDAMVEQKERQVTTELAISDQQKAHKERKQTSRKVARKRARTGRGAFALWKQIKGIA